MRNPVAKITFAALGTPVDVVAVAEGTTSSELRVDWLEDPPNNICKTEWSATPQNCEFVGFFEHIKAVKPFAPCQVRARIYDENGFYFDTPEVCVVTYTQSEPE